MKQGGHLKYGISFIAAQVILTFFNFYIESFYLILEIFFTTVRHKYSFYLGLAGIKCFGCFLVQQLGT